MFTLELLKRKYEYSQNIILVNKESGWTLERAPLTALAVGFDSLHPYSNLYAQRNSTSVTVPLLDSVGTRQVCCSHFRYSQLYASFCLVVSTV